MLYLHKLNIVHCVPEEHEILTNEGFMDLDTFTARQAVVGDALLVAGYDAHTRTMLYERPVRLVVHKRAPRTLVALSSSSSSNVDFERDSDSVDDTASVDLLVTAQHQMYVQRARSTTLSDDVVWDAAFCKVPASQLLAGADTHSAFRQLAGAECGVAARWRPRSLDELCAWVTARADATPDSCCVSYDVKTRRVCV
jgi:hypothetical protein